jgi:hypothetical protein
MKKSVIILFSLFFFIILFSLFLKQENFQKFEIDLKEIILLSEIIPIDFSKIKELEEAEKKVL